MSLALPEIKTQKPGAPHVATVWASAQAKSRDQSDAVAVPFKRRSPWVGIPDTKLRELQQEQSSSSFQTHTR